MSSCTKLNKTLGWRLFSFLEENPNHYDVAFSVGPKKTIVKAMSIILRVSSPVLEREFKDRWDQAVMKEGEEGILLPDLDPVAFKLFLKLMILDTWSVDDLKALKLPSSQLLHLMTICRKYEMTVAVESLTELLEEFFRSFPTYVETDDFLLLSEQQLKSILASDEIPMDERDVCRNACKSTRKKILRELLHLFHYAIKAPRDIPVEILVTSVFHSWADEQCKKQNLEVTSLNQRTVLGKCLYRIRFPLMSLTEFTEVTRLHNGLLLMEEIIQIFQLIGTDENARAAYNTNELKFKFEKRKLENTSVPSGCSVLSVVKVRPIIDSPFVCDGSLDLNKGNYFNTDMKIKLRGCGFVGPIDADSFYDVTVQLWKRTNGSSYQNNAAFGNKLEKRIFAQKSKTFYFIFDEPVVLEPIPHDGWKNAYLFHFSLKGPNTRSLQGSGSTQTIYDDKREFSIWWSRPQMLEILYNTC